MKQRVDLLPQINITRKLIRKRILMWGAALGVALVGLLLVAASLRGRAQSFEREMVEPYRNHALLMRDQEAQLRGLVEKLEKAHLEALEESARGERLEVFLHEPFWVGLLNDLADSTGEALWLTEFSLSKKRPRSGAGAKTALTVAGRALSDPDVIAFINQFAQSRYVESFGLQYSGAARGADSGKQVEFKAVGVVR